MDVTLEQVERLTPVTARALIPSWLAGFVDDDPETKRDLEARTAAAMAEYSDEEVAKAVQALLAVGDHYQLYEADLVARAVTRACMRALVDAPVLEIIDIDLVNHRNHGSGLGQIQRVAAVLVLNTPGHRSMGIAMVGRRIKCLGDLHSIGGIQ